jgi:hypothetical protein
MALRIGNWGLPEFQITERLANRISGGRTQDLSNALSRSYAAAPQPQTPTYQAPYSAPRSVGQSNNTTQVPTTSGGTSGQVRGASTQVPYENLQGQQDSGLDLIEQDYNNALGMFAGQEESLRSQAGTAGQQIDTEAGQVQSQLKNEEAVGVQGVQSGQQVAETGAKSAMQEARDLFRQTQQSNIAQLSALGISSSSVAEALAERLGVETARRIAGVSDNIQTVRQNAAKEISRIQTYTSEKLTNIQKQVQVQKANIQNSLIQGLNQINSGRNQAATDKARSRQELITNTQNAIYSLTQQAQQFEQSLKQWVAQKSEALNPIVTDPTFLNTLNQATSNFNQSYAPTGFQYAPEVSTDAYGRVKGNINYNLQKKNDEKTNPYQPGTAEYNDWQVLQQISGK